MKLWLISQTQNRNYDTYDSAVVAAETEDDAKNTQPNPYNTWNDSSWSDWASSPEMVQAEYIGEAKPNTEAGVIMASFNAG